MDVLPLDKKLAADIVVAHHYLHRAPPISFSFGLWLPGGLVGVVTFGVPASRHLQKSACPSEPGLVLELSRLWVSDLCPRNTESFFVRAAMRLLPPAIIVSYADTAQGHQGIIYRAAGFKYAGWSDMERKTPRFDYTVPGKHSRAAYRDSPNPKALERIRRKAKIKYWEVTGNRRERKRLKRLCGWPSLCWKETPPPK